MSKERIVLIEDHADMRENIAEILRLSNYEVFTAANGKTGVGLIQAKMPDLIICDIMMPELDGYGVIHILQQNAETADIPFIFLTAKAEKSDFRKGMNLGADDYLTKPFEDVDLLNAIEMRLRKNQHQRSHFFTGQQTFSDFFDKVSQYSEFKGLANRKRAHIFKKKEFLFMEGEQPKDLHFIVRGKVKTFKTTQDGKELITTINVSGNFIGYLALLENTVYQESAVAMEDSEVTVIPKSDFLSLVYSNKEVATKFIQILSNHLSEVEQRLLDIAYKSVRQRVAVSLLQLRHLHEKQTLKQDSVVIARKDLSAIVGSATESLNRTLADFKEEGMIEITDHSLKIVNQQKLEKLAHS